MSIRIESLSVNGLGPISSIKWFFKDINLIYGKNEKGKTYLVEYLLSSLFKNVKNTRLLTDSGQVTIAGLESVPTVLQPKIRRKLEEYFFTGDEKPVDLSRLCVVKGGELSFLTGGEVSLTKSVLKEYLSDQRTLDTIDKAISATIKASTWENGNIVGGRQAGEIKNWNELRDKIKQIDNLLEEVNQAYSLGEIKKMKDKLVEVNQLIADQDLARRAYAYSLWQLIQEKERELDQISAKDLDQAKVLVRKIEDMSDLIKKNQREISNLEPKFEHYNWLKTAIDECEKRPEAFTGRWIWVLVTLAIFSTLTTIVFAFMSYPYYSLGAGVLAILLIVLVISKYRSKLRSSADRTEIENIFQEYESKFGLKARAIATLKSTWQDLSLTYGELSLLKTQIKGYEKDLSDNTKDLRIKLELLVGKKVNLKDPVAVIDSLQKKREQLASQLSQLRTQHAVLDVQEDEYVKDLTDVKFSSTLLKDGRNRKRELEDRILAQENLLNNLKSNIIFLTNDPLSIDWEELIDHLRDKRENIVKLARQTQAQIGSGILVFQVINEIRTQEDESISKALTSPGICQPIQALTHAYDGIDVEGNDIIAYNSIQRFPLSGLSTGAQEQVLLALRIGIASQVLKDQKMFLILDDAFQHSDWERREWLVDEMGTLANLGWQIIYFSMDDHIKSLFEERLKPKFKDRYQAFELNQ